jgi:hypothetical protein
MQVGAIELGGPEVIPYVGAVYTATVRGTDGLPFRGAIVTMTAPADTTFSGSSSATGATDGAGRFSARLSATNNEESGERTLVATSGGTTATMSVIIPAPSVGFTFPIGALFTTPFVVQLRALVLPEATEPGHFQGRVMAPLAASADTWLTSDGTTSSLSRPAWTELNIGEWYTGGKAEDGTVFDTRIAWGRLDGNVGAVDQPLDAPVGLGTPNLTMSVELRRLDMDTRHPNLRIEARWLRVNGTSETQVGTGWTSFGAF